MTEIEALVRRKDKLQATQAQLDHWRVNIRLRDRLRIAYNPRPWLGFLGRTQLVEVVPDVVEHQFYEFLGQRIEALRIEIAEIETLLGNAKFRENGS